ncbi:MULTISPECIES: esterase [unclassified Amycolatopsis]|uniref:alpha/beta hydrolase family protein n=1 Tax=unclassified Amycolatopsis TaxID=2618356 RepID=UPI0028770D46|nr:MULTISPECIES: esterase [unclassified Amycolatopsis]MDS0132217.1 esterase [Amycolatopsis sp. 505]MDS0141045.1 esterase [Amycolatopsis sp. CM201R]
MRIKSLVAGTALTLTLTSPSASADPALTLAKPTGDRPVGTTALHLKDTSRPDPWVPSVPYRELMVSLFYPAASASGPKKQFMSEAEAKAVFDEAGIEGIPPSVLTTVHTDAVVDAKPAGRALPAVVLSPGFKRPRAELTSLSEDLASHGYLVVLVDHTYENVATTFPDGRVTGCAACGDYNPEFWQKLQRGRAKDVSFVLDSLAHSKWAPLFDGARIGMAGHSVGGTSTVNAMVTDPRIKAGIDIDGTQNDPLLAPGLDRPFLFFGRQSLYAPGTGVESGTWDDDWKQLKGWKRWLTVAGVVHPSFTDIGLVGEQPGLDFGATTPAVRGQAITAAYVRAFFDQHLRGKPQPLLDQPSGRYPEVVFARTSTPYLPAPTGDKPVGSTAVYLKDTSRPDPWVPSVPYRELMVSLFYPAASAKGPKTPYLTPAESAALLQGSGLPSDTLTGMVTNSVTDARPAGRGLPLVVLSPGYTKPRATLSALAEDLASHGYAVAVVGHTYENTGQSFPDGRFAGCASCEVPHDNDAFWQKLERGRAADVSFVLDSLLRSRPGLVDPARIGMAGHSVGGASTIPAMVADNRIKAGIDIDGSTKVPLTAPGLSRPFMFVNHEQVPKCAPGNTDWERDYAQMTGWKRWIEVAGTQHASFTDVGLLGEELGVPVDGPNAAARASEITRAYVNAFFDQHLRGKPQPILDRPGYPEVSFCR